MAFTAAELANIANAAFDFYMKGDALKQAQQARPLLDALRRGQKTFPGGKGDIRRNVKGAPTTALMGYTHNDTVTYGNPANIKQVNYPWKELHSGIAVTHTELKMDGISVVDTNGEETSQHSERELTAITNLLDDKLDDMTQGTADSLNEMLWLDGTQDAKEIPGIRSILSETPAIGTVGGIDAAANAWWRNRVSLAIAPSASLQTLSRELRSEVRQLRRYGGKPSLVLCGSDFLDALDVEITEKGQYTQEGFLKSGSTDIGMADISMRGVGRFIYDPTLDDQGKSKYCYMIDPSKLYLDVMDGEDMKKHSPARPHDQYVLYRGTTLTAGLVCVQRNAHGIYSIA